MALNTEKSFKEICAMGNIEEFKEFFSISQHYAQLDYYRDLSGSLGMPLLVKNNKNDVAVFALSQVIKLNLIPKKVGVAKSYLLAKMLEAAGTNQNIEFMNFIYSGKMEQYLLDAEENTSSILFSIKNFFKDKPIVNAKDKKFKCGFDLLKTVAKVNNNQIFDMVFENHVKYNKLSRLEKFYLHGLTELTKNSEYVQYVDKKIGFDEKMLNDYDSQVYSGHYG